MTHPIRVRFAPSPTGIMHLGNARTALLNYLLAQSSSGTFVLRVEDTDPTRNLDPGAKQIQADLAWLGLAYTEGPGVGGPHAPYFQSERTDLYTQKLQELQNKELVYRCFCTSEELDRKRQRQIMLKRPPRYDRTCAKLDSADVEKKVAAGTPFIWRVRVPSEDELAVSDMARGTIKFNFKDFSDFPVTRQDGSFTFMFANCVDDIAMQITHVLRGEDHLTNTVGQTVLYQAFGAPIPTFWHMPIMCNLDGKKLSKRDFGFSLKDLGEAGFVPEAICNYLGILGGSFEQEIMSLDALAQAIDFAHLKPTGQIKYDVEKLRWVNHKWLSSYDVKKLAQLCLPFVAKKHPAAQNLETKIFEQLVTAVQTDLHTLVDAAETLDFYFAGSDVSQKEAAAFAGDAFEQITQAVQANLDKLADADAFMQALKAAGAQQNIKAKLLWGTVRMALTGKPHGLSIHALLDLLGVEETQKRLAKVF